MSENEIVPKEEKVAEAPVSTGASSSVETKKDELKSDWPFQKEVVLPSQGKWYDDKLPDGKVTIRPITVTEEKLLMARGSRGKIIDRLCEKCILSDCIPMSEMLVTDKFFLLLNLRALTYGPDYGFTLECPSCGTKFKHSVVLPDGLTVMVATDDDVEPFDVKLPVCGKTVSLRFLRGEDEEKIESFARNQPNVKPEDGDPTYAYRLSCYLVAIDGKQVDSLEALHFCERMIGGDSAVYRRAIADHETGVDLTINAACPSCREEVSTSIPMTSDFFQASVS